jgi:HSP20 family protein
LESGGSRLARALSTEGIGSYFPDLDISETDGHINVTAEVPGMTDKDIKVNLADDGETLSIEGEKHTELETKKADLFCQERRYGRFRRVITLPNIVDPNQVQATCKDGILTIHMQKLPEKEQHVKQIPVKSA